ncbi:maleylpyruvate isomerase family mycothiol-dependent enzyme [Nonomuraea sp. NPDC050404]|uniref:maleylpyruvate isomerase family mycothiol-dependent enzyme n=1 Tax=Nonomuraea sp. NPDC050404 TaxID=3155783 RepID=UPI0033CC9175
MNEWDATSYAGKDTILRVVRDEAERLFAMAEPEEAWQAPTACTGWAARDVVAHIVDTTEGYFAAFDAARAGGAPGTAYGLPGMGARVNDQAVALRGIPQKELLDRLRMDFERMQAILRELGEREWAGLTVPHFYMGPLPAYFFAAGQLMDYAVHSWDIRQGTGRAHGLSGEAADLLVPFMFVLWQSTVRPGADLTPFELGIRVGGVNGGDFRVSVGQGGMTYTKGPIDGMPAVIEFDAGSMVLATFGRGNTGTVRGDLALADRYLNLFFRI